MWIIHVAANGEEGAFDAVRFKSIEQSAVRDRAEWSRDGRPVEIVHGDGDCWRGSRARQGSGLEEGSARHTSMIAAFARTAP